MINAIEKDALWVLKNYGSDAGEKKKPGSKAESQARRIAEFVRQWIEVMNFINENNIDLIILKERG